MLWANTSLGLLLYWWHANKQQSGRGSIGVSALETMPILDVTALSKKQLDAAVKLFDEVCKLDLRPLHEIANDSNRQKLDESFARDVLGLKPTVIKTGGPRIVTKEIGTRAINSRAKKIVSEPFPLSPPSKRHKQPLAFSVASHRATCATCPFPCESDLWPSCSAVRLSLAPSPSSHGSVAKNNLFVRQKADFAGRI